MDLERSSQKRFTVWLLQSQFDLEAAQSSFNNGHFEWSCYQSVQSVEKALKAVIVHAGFRPPQTHKLGILVSMCNRANVLFTAIQLPFRKIESYTFIARYPFVIPGENKTPREFITKKDAETCLSIAVNILTKIKQFLDRAASEAQDGDNSIEDTEKGYFYTAKEIDDRIEILVTELRECTELDVRKIILYGSFAREKTRSRTTTMDILIIAETKLSFIERIQYVREVTKGSSPIVEPIVYTPEEFTFMIEEEGEGYLESAIDEGRVLWERG